MHMLFCLPYRRFHVFFILIHGQFPRNVILYSMQYCTAFFIFVEKEASCLMQWKNASLKYESQTDRLILKVLTPNYANAVLNFQNRNRESFEAYEPTRPANFYTASYQQAVLKCEWDLALKQQCIRFYVSGRMIRNDHRNRMPARHPLCSIFLHRDRL